MKPYKAAFSLLLCICFLSSCAPSVPQTSILPQSTEALFETVNNVAPVNAADIVYPTDDVPTVYITTENGYQVTKKDVYTSCNFRIELNGVFSEFESTYTDENGGGAQIHCRGNSSYSRAETKKVNKYSYKLKLDTKADLFGLGESKQWYLINNWFDVSALRNKLAYDFSGALGLTYTQSTWVELYYNGEYRGLYLLTESLDIGEGRVETVDWEEFGEDVATAYAKNNALPAADEYRLVLALKSDLSWITTGNINLYLSSTGAGIIDLTPYFDPDSIDLNSGYLIEYDGRLDGDRTKWSTEHKIPVALKSPERLSTNPEMYEYLKTLIQDFEDALFSPTFHNEKGKHYSEYLDVQSLVDYWLVWTLFNNQEFGYLSMYYYVDGGKIHFGPCWDFDFACGNIVTLSEKWVGYSQWTTDRGGGWYREILGDPYFSVLCQERWYEIRELTDDLLRSLDIYRAYMGDAAIRCNKRCGTRANWYLKDLNGGHSYDFETDFENLKNWLYNRVAWLDEMLGVPDAKIDNSTNSRNANLVTSVSLNGQTLNRNTFDIYGVQTDHTVLVSASGQLTVKVNTTQSAAATCALYLNGSTFIGESRIGIGERAEFTIDVSLLCLNEGAVNVLYLPVFKKDGSYHSMTSVLIRVSDYAPSADEYTVKCGDSLYKIKQGETLVLPEITKAREGFVAEGWTDGKSLYRPGESITPTDSIELYIRFKRTKIFSAMDMAK